MDQTRDLQDGCPMDGLTLSDLTTIWSKLCNKLINRYDILGGYNLIDYSHDMQVLKNTLSIYQGKKFGEDQRLIFSLYDTEFYYEDARIGFDVFNLITILIDLDIDLNYCLLFTNHYGYSENIKKFCAQQGAAGNLQVFENSFCFLQTSDCVPDLSASAKHIEKHFAFLANVRRDHRNYIRLLIEDRQLHAKTLMAWNPQGLITWNRPRGEHDRAEEAKAHAKVTQHSVLVTTVPFVRGRNKIPIDPDLAVLYNTHKQAIEKYHRDPLLDLGPNENNFVTDFLQKIFVNIVCETVFEYPYPYVTEKTFKCFWSQRPFVLVGAPRSIANLQAHGMRSFSDYWDEGYDQETDQVKRLKLLFTIIDEISKWSLKTCKSVYNDMKPILEHNRRWYHDYVCGKMYDDLLENLDCK